MLESCQAIHVYVFNGQCSRADHVTEELHRVREEVTFLKLKKDPRFLKHFENSMNPLQVFFELIYDDNYIIDVYKALLSLEPTKEDVEGSFERGRCVHHAEWNQLESVRLGFAREGGSVLFRVMYGHFFPVPGVSVKGGEDVFLRTDSM